jgi:hypothetical protein
MKVIVTLSDQGTSLEVQAALFSDPSKLFPALESVDVVSMSNYLVRTRDRLILHAKLSEKNGSPLSDHRAFEAMKVVQSQMGDV